MIIIHVLADGTKTENISGHVVGEEIKDFYQVVKKIIGDA